MLQPVEYANFLKVNAEYQKTRAEFDEVTLNRVKEILRWESENLDVCYDIEGDPDTEYQYELSYFETGVQLRVTRTQYVTVDSEYFFFPKEKLFSDSWKECYLAEKE